MIDGERRGYQAGAEAITPVIEEARLAGNLVRLPSDEELVQLAADTWTEYQSRGYAHIEPRHAFLAGYVQACQYLLATFTQPGKEESHTVL